MFGPLSEMPMVGRKYGAIHFSWQCLRDEARVLYETTPHIQKGSAE